MKLQRSLGFASVVVLGSLAAALASARPVLGVDLNRKTRPMPLSPQQLRDLIAAEEASAGGSPLATAIFPGPLTSFGITLTVANNSAAEITDMTFDPFGGLMGAGLVIESVFSVSGGAATTLQYPLASGRGPVVASFSSFDLGDMVSFGMDPDSYDNGSFGATVADMAGSRVELAFSDGTRAAGVLRVTDLGNAAAFVSQTFP